MKNVWVLEDLPESHVWLSKALDAVFPGIAVQRFFRLSDALEAARTLPAPDLALVSPASPDGSGIELIKLFNDQASHTVCVVASIYDDDLHLMPRCAPVRKVSC